MQSLLPYSYQDKNNLALENCIKQALDIDAAGLMIFPVENTPDFLLPYLAKEFHITNYEGWILADTTEKKQNLITNF